MLITCCVDISCLKNIFLKGEIFSQLSYYEQNLGNVKIKLDIKKIFQRARSIRK